MTDDRSARTLGAVLFLTAALFVGINRIITAAPLGEFWLAILLLVFGVALIAWNIVEMRPRAASAGATVSSSGEMALFDGRLEGNPERVAVREFFPAPATERTLSTPALGSPRGLRVADATERTVVVEPILDDMSVDVPAPSEQAPVSEQLATTVPDELIHEDLAREEHPEGADGVRLASASPVEPVIQVTPIDEPTLLPPVPAEAFTPAQTNAPEPTIETAVTATPKTDPVGQTVMETEVQPQQPHEAAQTGVVTPDIARQTNLPPTNPEARLDGMENKSALGHESAVAMSSPGAQGSASPAASTNMETMSGMDSRGEPSANAATVVGVPNEPQIDPPATPGQAPVKEPLQTPYGDPPVREPQPEPTPGGDPPRTEPPLTEPPGGDPPQSVAGISVDTAPDEARRTTPTASVASGIPVTEPTAVGKPDDLKQIEGIGPKIATALVAHGVMTFDKLASTPETELRSILSAANVRIVGNVSSSMKTWAEQAGMASRGEWDALKAWQASYKMGKE